MKRKVRNPNGFNLYRNGKFWMIICEGDNELEARQNIRNYVNINNFDFKDFTYQKFENHSNEGFEVNTIFAKPFTKEELKGKFVVYFDTICEGFQCGKDENDNPHPHLYNSYDEAFKEKFIDASCGIEGNEEYFMEDEVEGYDLDDPKDVKKMEKDQAKRDKIISDMKALIKNDDIKGMKAFFQKEPDANYYDEYIEKAEDFIVGRRAFFTSSGVVIEGTKLEDL